MTRVDPFAKCSRAARRAAKRCGHWLAPLRMGKDNPLAYGCACRFCGSSLVVWFTAGTWRADGPALTNTCRGPK